MAQAVRERIGELGVLKTIGFTDRQVLGLVWLFTPRGDPTGGLLPLVYFPKTDLLLGVALRRL